MNLCNQALRGKRVTSVFVYGTLMYDEVWSRIVIGKYKRIDAQLSGYRRLKFKDENCPGIVKGEGTVKGLVRLQVDQDNVARLDTFEGTYYERVQEVVQARIFNLVFDIPTFQRP